MSRPGGATKRPPGSQRSTKPHPEPVVRRWPRRVAVGLLAVLVFGIGLAWPILVRPALVIGQDAISNRASTAVQPELVDAGGWAILARPPEGVVDRGFLLVLYPGALVRPQAYEWLARRLAADGILTVIPEFSFDLPITDPNRANQLVSKFGVDRKLVLAGHSLGGVMAAQYLSDQAEFGSRPAAGLILLAAYPAGGNDLSGADLPVLSVQAEHDQVIDAAALADGWNRLPADTRRVVLTGAVHSFFGRYGAQSGDGVATVSRTTAENQLVAALEAFLAELG